MNDTKVYLNRLIAADCKRVFADWTSPRALAEWHCGTVRSCVMDLKIGGEFSIEFEAEENCNHAVVRGKYIEIQRPHRLQYSWQWDGAEAEPSTVTVDFLEVDDQTMKIQLTHELLGTEQLRGDHMQGWNACLDGLESYIKSVKSKDEPGGDGV